MKEKKRGLKKFSNNRLLYFFVTILIVAVLAVGVYAYGTSNPSIFGHSYGEIGAPAGCSAGQVLQYNGTNFVCGSGGSGGGACPSGMTINYIYADEGEDSYTTVSGSPSSNPSALGADTCDGDVMAQYVGSSDFPCRPDMSVSCRDIYYAPNPNKYYYAYNIFCKRRATIKCVE